MSRGYKPQVPYRSIKLGAVAVDDGGEFSLPAASESPANAPRIGVKSVGASPALLPFVAVKSTVMRGSEHIATACSKTMAKRIANALNRHTPNSEGV